MAKKVSFSGNVEHDEEEWHVDDVDSVGEPAQWYEYLPRKETAQATCAHRKTQKIVVRLRTIPRTRKKNVMHMLITFLMN